MDFKATDEQRVVINAGLVPLKVVACAGSGKTATAVRRLVEVRRRMGRSRGYAVLLSFSNVAVDTFRQQYALEASKQSDLSDRVLICTADSFLTNYILAPHAAQVMGSKCRPYLARGREGFLENKAFSVFDGNRRVSLANVDVRSGGDGKWNFVNRKTKKVLPDASTRRAIRALGKTGAFTHALGRLWALLTLRDTPRLAEVLAIRFPHILVDEAQDVGPLHGQILTHVANAGTVLAIVGDPNQAIFEFANADGKFLMEFAVPDDGIDQPITENRRSVSQIINVANSVARGAKSKPVRIPPERTHGAYYLQYEPSELGALVTRFGAILEANKFSPSEAAILARGGTLAAQLRGGKEGFGQGATKLFAEAAVNRDVGDIATAFERALDGMLRLLDTDDNHLRSAAASGERGSVAATLRTCVWRFLRDREFGIPSAKLPAAEWHAALIKRLPDALSEIRTVCGFTIRKSWRMNVTIKALGTAPLFEEAPHGLEGKNIRMSTVHKVKGETIPAVLYVTNGKSLNSLLAGAVNEEGRIGYVAITRAGDLLIVAIPRATAPRKVKALTALGLQEWTG